ncbi:sensor histidine kinase [Tropicimonas sediminicola]|uniref:histidine kinase n=1 Tax=Tropicimonas sediminicola TaxID=1031541 RepID=A0A239LL53_9RHOB|nr:sensor histidine kinase [Tropicimonas sediminicola]SNT31040.1 two-component system, OmpR family, sensor histidine kinase TctE [Tropicimonas sediminicola]
MPRTFSLRTRLFVLILTPLVLMAIVLGYWRFTVAQKTAWELFDRSLLAAGLAISRDVAISEGDALSPSTRDLIRDASGGEVFYHATGPGGIYVTGYAYPPTGGTRSEDPYHPQFFESDYRQEPVRVLRMTERRTIDNLTGDATVTVWQRIADRRAFANQLAVWAAVLMLALLATLALVVWFGVERGLRPLIDLEDAIEARSPNDLSIIKRAVPEETRGIVETLNRLFAQVEASITAHQVFISDAAHQLRNPAAAVQSMAEAARDATTEEERVRRLDELVTATRSAARVTEQLLSLDRLRHGGGDDRFVPFDLNQLVEETCADLAPSVLVAGKDFELDLAQSALPVRGDHVFMSEALKNLVDNAMKHGGSDLSRISVGTELRGAMAEVTVKDDGRGLSPDMSELAFSRFSQVEPSDGSGLGLAIALSVAEQHGGTLRINPSHKGASLTIALPLTAPVAA